MRRKTIAPIRLSNAN